MNDYSLFSHIVLVTLEYLGLWLDCEPEQGRFNVWNQTFTDGDAGKTAVCSVFSRTSLRLHSWTSQGRMLQSMV